METLLYLSNFLSPVFSKILYMTVIGTAIGFLILITRKLPKHLFSPKWICLMWYVCLVFLFVPISRIPIHIPTNNTISDGIDKIESTIHDLSIDNYNIPSGQNNMEEEHQEQINAQAVFSSTPITALSIYNIFSILWLIGFSIGLFLLIFKNILLIYKIHSLRTIKNGRIQNILIECKNQLHIFQKVTLKLQYFQSTPCIYGIFSPKILVSEDFLDKDDETIKNIFMHELSHYKRKDTLTNYILLFVTVIHWFNPCVWYFFKKIRQDIELATDQMVLSKMNKEQSKQYGRTLIGLLNTFDNHAVTAKMLYISDDDKSIENRIHMIKKSDKIKKYSVYTGVTTIFFVICISFLTLFKFDQTNAQSIDNLLSSNEIENDINSEIVAENGSINTSDLIAGDWIPFKSEENGKEIPLNVLYGSGLSSSNTLTFSPNGSYTYFVGIQSIDNTKELQGSYLAQSNNIHLTSENGKEKTLEYIQNSNSENIIKEDYGDGIYVYFRKK